MTAITRFPSRIRFVNADGTLTPEALRTLDSLVSRTGGAIGDVGLDMFAAPASADDRPLGLPDITAPATAGDGLAAPHVAAPMQLPDNLTPVELQPASPGHALETTFQSGSDGGSRMDELIIQPASAAAPILALAAGASPMSFIARDGGTLSVAGGAVSEITLARGAASVQLGITAGLVPMAAGDKVTLTWSTAPNINFIPR